jgi:hypothetical protein
MLKATLPTLCLVGVFLSTGLGGCAVCKSSDNVEQCRTKERDHGRSRVSIPTKDNSALPT